MGAYLYHWPVMARADVREKLCWNAALGGRSCGFSCLTGTCIVALGGRDFVRDITGAHVKRSSRHDGNGNRPTNTPGHRGAGRHILQHSMMLFFQVDM